MLLLFFSGPPSQAFRNFFRAVPFAAPARVGEQSGLPQRGTAQEKMTARRDLRTVEAEF